jgi:hypothetical protein
MGKAELDTAIAALEGSLSTINTWLLIFSAVVAIGVGGEAFFGVAAWMKDRQLRPLRAMQVQLHETELSEQRRMTAEAIERANEASLELAKFKAPRTLNEQQMQSMIRTMAQFAGQHISVGAIPFSFESASLADQIVRALKEAHVNADMNEGAAEVQVGAAHGVVAVATTGNEKGEKFAAAFAKTMNDSGIKTTASSGLLESVMGETIKQGRKRTDDGFSWVVIVVGDKP